jgi:hypothetical protein
MDTIALTVLRRICKDEALLYLLQERINAINAGIVELGHKEQNHLKSQQR